MVKYQGMRKLIFTFLAASLLLQWSMPVQALGVLRVAGLPSDSVAAIPTIQQTSTNDPLFPNQTYLNQIGIPSAWDRTTGSNFPIAIIDTGIDLHHADIGQLWTNTDEIPNNSIDDDANGYVDDYHGYNFLYRNTDLQDTHGHGTGIASIIAAATNNSLGTSGINWQASLMVLRALNSAGSGDFSTVSEAIRYAVDNGAKIINMSFGSVTGVINLQSAVDYAIARQVTIVAAVGNNYGQSVFYPAAYPSVIAVGSVSDSGQLSSFSNYGVGVDLVAPGENVLVANLPSQGISTYSRSSGSSFAAAEVTGVVSLLLSLYPALSPVQIDTILRTTADPLPNDPDGLKFGAGRVNASRAINYQTKTLTGSHYLVNNSAPADGISGVTVNVVVVDQFGQPQTGLPISARVTGSTILHQGSLMREGVATAIGTTDGTGRISFTLESTTSGTKQISLFSGANEIGLSTGAMIVNFRSVTSPRYAMQWIKQSPSVIMDLGDTASLWVEIKNTGNVAWVSDPQATLPKGNLQFGTARPLNRSSSFYDSQTWSAVNRSAYLSPPVVRPGEIGRFNFTIRANQAGKFREYFRPVVEYVSWLNDLGIYWDITVNNQNLVGSSIFNLLTSTNPQDYNADIRGKTNNLTLAPGQKVGLWIDLVNTGSAAWMNNGKDLQGTGAVKLGTVSPHDRVSAFYASTWRSPNRVVGPSIMVPPNDTVELVFEIQAPMKKGIYQENFQLVSEYVTWFGPVFGWTITVA